ncbi:HNH endonuclease, partial [Mycobacteroides abscessus subsp. massiliense]
DPLAAPKMGIEQAKEFYNHPGEFIGKNLIHGTEALAGGAVGGEAAAGARGLLGDLTGTEGRALTHGLDNPHPAPTVEHGGGGGGGGGIGGDHTSGVGDHGGGPGGHGMPGGNPTPFDFDTPIDTARPEFN